MIMGFLYAGFILDADFRSQSYLNQNDGQKNCYRDFPFHGSRRMNDMF